MTEPKPSLRRLQLGCPSCRARRIWCDGRSPACQMYTDEPATPMMEMALDSEEDELGNAFHSAAEKPPITQQSLSELDISSIINNIKLRHDVNFDRDLSFRPNLDGRKGQEKKRQSTKYWRALGAELDLYESEQRTTKMVETIDEVLITLTPRHDLDSGNDLTPSSMPTLQKSDNMRVAGLREHAVGTNAESGDAKAAHGMRKTAACWHCVLLRDRSGVDAICERCSKRSQRLKLRDELDSRLVDLRLLEVKFSVLEDEMSKELDERIMLLRRGQINLQSYLDFIPEGAWQRVSLKTELETAQADVERLKQLCTRDGVDLTYSQTYNPWDYRTLKDQSSEDTAGGGSTPDLTTLSLMESGKGRQSPYSGKKRPADSEFNARRGKAAWAAITHKLPASVLPERKVRQGLPILFENGRSRPVVMTGYDTGTEANHISLDLAKQMELKIATSAQNCAEFKLANGKVVRSIGRATAKIKFAQDSNGNEEAEGILCHFNVFKTLAVPALMGMAFLKATETLSKYTSRLVDIPRDWKRSLRICAVGAATNQVSCVIEGKPVIAYADTGSEIALVNADYLARTFPDHEVEPYEEEIMLADGTIDYTSGFVDVDFSLGSDTSRPWDTAKTRRVRFHVLADLQFDVLLDEDLVHEFDVFRKGAHAFISDGIRFISSIATIIRLGRVEEALSTATGKVGGWTKSLFKLSPKASSDTSAPGPGTAGAAQDHPDDIQRRIDELDQAENRQRDWADRKNHAPNSREAQKEIARRVAYASERADLVERYRAVA